VRVFSSRTCETFRLPDLGVALHGHSFPNRAVPEDLSARYPAPEAGMVNIGVLHTSGDDPGDHAVYAPCTVGGLTLKGYDYWALGHIHRRQVLSERPWIVFPGNPQGRHPKETGAKGCTLVTVEDQRIVSAEHRTLDVLRWAGLTVDATGLDEPGMIAAAGEAVRGALAEADERPVLARLTVTGSAALPDPDRLAAECRAAAIAAGGALWIEAVKNRTRPVAAGGGGSLEALREAFLAGLGDPGIVDKLRSEFDSLRQKLPAPARGELELPGDEVALRELAEEAWELAAAAIGGAET